jgi:3'(2'), 5'-bisphosphate nucleotidase
VRLSRSDIDQIETLARAAGDAILAIYAGAPEAWTKDDGSPLTRADLRADAVLCEGLSRTFPGIPLVSEESGTHGPAADVFFLIDPLDGTKEFLQRSGEFTVNVGLIVDGVPAAGVVLAPVTAECFCAGAGLGSWRATAGGPVPLRVRPFVPGAPLRITGSRSHGTDTLQACLDALPVPHVFTAAGSSLKFCRVAQGDADAYPRFGPTSQWDTAAAQCVVEQAGGCVLGPDGARLRYGMDRPMTNPSFAALSDARLFDWFRAWT